MRHENDMILQNDFLQKALPEAIIVCGNELLGTMLLSVGVSERAQIWLNKHVDAVHVSIDSRDVERGGFFCAIKGSNVDGHEYINEAIMSGSRGIIMARSYLNHLDQGALLDTILLIIVEDPYQAVIDLACAWRAHLTCPIIGVTGSVGKTTTKEMLRKIFEYNHIPATVSEKTYNTDLGISLSLIKARLNDRVVVCEVGINAVGEMDRCVGILRPTIVIVTNIFDSHGQGLGNSASIAHEKLKLVSLLKPEDLVCINGDDPLLINREYSQRVITFGSGESNDVVCRNIQLIFPFCVFDLYLDKVTRIPVSLRMAHRGAVYDALAAVAIALQFGLEIQPIVNALQDYYPFYRRFQQKSLGACVGTIIDDSYNASPASMQVALEAFDAICGEKKIVVLGDMLELGDGSLEKHEHIGKLVSSVQGMQAAIFVGSLAHHMAKTVTSGIPVICVKDWEEAYDKLQPELSHGVFVLIKASLRVGLDRLVKKLRTSTL